MWQSLLGLLASQPGGQTQENSLDKRRQYFQQLLSGQNPVMSYGGARYMGGQDNTGDIMNLAQLLSGRRQPMNQPMNQYQAPQQPMQHPYMNYNRIA